MGKSYKHRVTQEWINAIFELQSYKTCEVCEGDLLHEIQFTTHPYFVPLIVDNVPMSVSLMVFIQDVAYRVCGLIYFGHEHFTVRIVDKEGQIWYNDGMTLGRECKYEGNILNADEMSIYKCKGKTLKVIMDCKV